MANATVNVTGVSAGTGVGPFSSTTGVAVGSLQYGNTTLLLAFDAGAVSRGEAPGGWWWDVYTPNIVMHYGEEGSQVHALLLGGNDGHLYQYEGASDNGTPIQIAFTTPSLDQSEPRQNKLYGDIMLDADTNGLTVIATPAFNNNSTLAPNVNVTTTTRELTTIPLGTNNIQNWQTARNISLTCSGSVNGEHPLFYIYEPRWTFESAPLSALSWEISPTTFGMENFKHFGICKITHVSSVDIILIFTVDGAVQPQITIANSAGLYTQTIFRVPVMKGKLFKLRIASSDAVTNVRIDPRDTFFEVKDWASDGPYNELRVFGDYSLVEG